MMKNALEVNILDKFINYTQPKYRIRVLKDLYIETYDDIGLWKRLLCKFAGIKVTKLYPLGEM